MPLNELDINEPEALQTLEPGPAERARAAVMASFSEEAPAGDATIPAPVAPPAEPPAPPAPNPAEVAVAERLAEIVRAESAMVAKQQSLRAELDAAAKEAAAARAELAAMKQALVDNPMELLRSNKWELEDIVKVAATKQTPEAVRAARLEAEVAALKRANEERDAQGKAATAAQESQAARDRLLNQYIPDQLKVVSDELPLCTAWFTPQELVTEVYGLMGREFERTKGASTLEPAEAARKVEAALRSRVEKVNPPAKVTPGTKTQQKPAPTVKPSVTVTNQTTQHRTANTDEVIAPGDIAALRKRALATANELWK